MHPDRFSPSVCPPDCCMVTTSLSDKSGKTLIPPSAFFHPFALLSKSEQTLLPTAFAHRIAHSFFCNCKRSSTRIISNCLVQNQFGIIYYFFFNNLEHFFFTISSPLAITANNAASICNKIWNNHLSFFH